MKNVKITPSASANRVSTWSIALLTLTSILGTTQVASAANQFDGFLNFFRVCDRVPELPPPRNKLSVEKQAEFKAVWTQVGIAGKKLEAAWENSVQNDPLMRRALKACDRYIQLEMQYNDLSRQLRAQYGAKMFREMETKWANWSKTQTNEWLDLKDCDLIRLSLCVLTYGGDQRWLKQEPFSRFANQQALFSQSDDHVTWNQTSELSREERLSKSILTKPEKLSEEDAIEVYKAGIQWLRQQNRNKLVPEIPARMQQYLKLRAEADYLFEAGETYLRMTPRPEVESAKQELTNLIKKAAVLRPDLNEALLEAHQGQ
ncbi:hypothetical protein [uncultured Gimesia sp.]|uniref:hypothetical protein n=1 Tax=uncultured Gimesia sp. TaxID=1678688 RepID=UPI0030D6F10E|tara:strand:+ start:104445 stop:105395 length:951 start_codon:yes stop_codon:yes gene_type:complete